MISLTQLWLPILVAAAFAFVASSILHMVGPWRRNDYPGIPGERQFSDAVRPLAIPPGDYMVPRAESMEEMKTDAFRARRREGPNMVITVMPNGEAGMGRALGLWFVFLLVVAQFGAYIASRTLPPGTHYLQVFRVVGATTFIGLVGGMWHMSIWYRRSWRLAIKDTVDSMVYALLMAGVFGWLWPR